MSTTAPRVAAAMAEPASTRSTVSGSYFKGDHQQSHVELTAPFLILISKKNAQRILLSKVEAEWIKVTQTEILLRD